MARTALKSSVSGFIAVSLAIFLFFVSGGQCQSTTATAVWPYQTFKSSNFTPPELLIQKTGPLDKGLLFIGQAGPLPIEAAPLIMTDDNQLVWQGPAGQIFNFGVQTYRGEPVLVFWTGQVFAEPIGRGSGVIHILNRNYEEIATVSLAGDFQTLIGQTYPSNIDLHEIYITLNNSVVVTANNVTRTDLTSVGGPKDGWAVDSLIYEIDIATNDVLFRWSSLEHLDQLPLSLSVYPLGSENFTGTNQSNAWGYFHINAASPYEDGYLISSRYLCSAIAISDNGTVKWRLQGRDGGDFDLGPGTNFCYQHDIRAVDKTSTHLTMHMHNNFNCPIDNGTNPTSGLSLSVDLASKNVTLLRKLLNLKDLIYSTAQGNYQPLPEGHVFLGHGYLPKIEEFDGRGNNVMTVEFGPGTGTLSYRSFRQSWIGCPTTMPNVTSTKENAGTAVYVSWNGATEVTAWEVYAGIGNASLSLVGTVKKTGFEIRAVIPPVYQYVQVQAVVPDVCACGNVTGKSVVLEV